MTYMASCGSTSCDQFDASQAQWFKIAQFSFVPGGKDPETGGLMWWHYLIKGPHPHASRCIHEAHNKSREQAHRRDAPNRYRPRRLPHPPRDNLNAERPHRILPLLHTSQHRRQRLGEALQHYNIPSRIYSRRPEFQAGYLWTEHRYDVYFPCWSAFEPSECESGPWGYGWCCWGAWGSGWVCACE